MGSFSETSDKKPVHVSIDSEQLDTGAHLDASLHSQLDPGESLRIRQKIDRHILPLMCILYCIQFMDKATLGSASILGILKAAHLTANQYNWLRLAFPVSGLNLIPMDQVRNDLLSRISRLRDPPEFGVAKVSRRKMDEVARTRSTKELRFLKRYVSSLNIFIWGIVVCCHAACKNFAGLFAVRFVLGICEGSITAGFMIVSSMFYTRREHTARVGYWFLMNGTAQIISGFISFGTLHIHTTGFQPWQWLMIITGTLTLITAVSFFFLFPDSPVNAWFLTEGERAKAVRRIKDNQTGVENKHFKKEQMIEALTDPKTWLFALFAVFDNIPNSIVNQLQIIIVSFGFNPLQTTLLGCVSGVAEIVVIFTGVTIASRVPNSIAWVGIASFIPSLLGLFLVNFLPWHDKVGLLFSVWIQISGITCAALLFTWVSQTTAGHTKRVTTNAIMLSASCIGNAAGPLMWKAKYKPRNHVPWIVIGVCCVSCMALMFSIRVLLAHENKRRDAEPPDNLFDDVHVVRIDEDGKRTEVKVSKEFLDLTDRQNRDFRFVL